MFKKKNLVNIGLLIFILSVNTMHQTFGASNNLQKLEKLVNNSTLKNSMLCASTMLLLLCTINLFYISNKANQVSKNTGLIKNYLQNFQKTLDINIQN
jgi:hypothetical protein